MIHPTARIDETVRVYGRKDLLSIGANTRIDAFCVITIGEDGMDIGSNVHISAGVYIFGSAAKVTIGDWCFLSPRATIYTETDNMSECSKVGPLAPREHRSVLTGRVKMWPHSGVGTGGIIFPGVSLGTGAVVGALSIAKRNVFAWDVVVGPNHRILGVRGDKGGSLLQ